MYLVALPFLKMKIGIITSLQHDFIYTNIFEAFTSYITLAFITTVYLLLPLFLYLIFGFFKLGLFSYEKNHISFLLRISFGLYIIAIFFLYLFILPLIFKFFLSFEEVTKTTFFTLKLEQKLIDFVFLILQFFTLFVLLFQIPIIFIYLLKQNIINFSFLKKNRRVFIVSIFIVSCFLSPPDLISLLVIATPLCTCFEIILFLLQIKESYKSLKLELRRLLEWKEVNFYIKKF
ncbi:sec-independent protein translocase protein TatC (mitochondrion) [Hemiselmis andersenii]|uniref:Sec-independent protein translocase protein TatC n=1 Tax=Hemiselmis andersenii TaxID=464988 RepID=B2MWV0_HEMAN|nr:sec-independent protein translocase protein TatC [Hemiselmis andersenii]ACC78242.1 sec-independent protein translocase protein TatC [Hemiselmis andersenii]